MALLSSFFAKCPRVSEDGPGQWRLCHTDTFLVSSVFSLSFIFFLPCPFFISSAISFISLLPFSGRWHKMTHKGCRVVKPQHKCMLKLSPLHNGGKIQPSLMAPFDVRPTGDQAVVGSTPSTWQHSFAEIWSWNIFYGLISADSRRAVVSFWWKNMLSTG